METSSKYQPKNNEISIWRNDKGDNPNRPDWTGTLTHEGQTFKVKFWKTMPKSGGDVYLNGKIEPLDAGASEAGKKALAEFEV